MILAWRLNINCKSIVCGEEELSELWVARMIFWFSHGVFIVDFNSVGGNKIQDTRYRFHKYYFQLNNIKFI
jgi:hypothetical protein